MTRPDPNLNGPANEAVQAIEALLHRSAEYEPVETAPADLTLRAFDTFREQEQRRELLARPQRRAALLTGVFGGAGATWATLAVALTLVTPGNEPAGRLRPFGDPSSGALRKRGRHGAAPAVLPPPVEPGATRGNASRTTAVPHRTGLRHAFWEVEREPSDLVARFEAPGWLIETDSATGALIATPGLLDVLIPASELGGLAEVAPEPETACRPPADAAPPAAGEDPAFVREEN